jgi:hypothetical protein
MMARNEARARPLQEVADIFRDHGSAWHDANRGQLKVMSAIESCRTAALVSTAAAHDDRIHDPDALIPPCSCCGARMRIIERFKRGETPRHPPPPRPSAIRIDTS